MHWLKINNRLLEMERNPINSEEFRKEWNNLLNMNTAGVLKRKKYEESGRKKKGEGGEEKAGQTNDERVIQENMG